MEDTDEEKEHSTPRSKVYGYYGRLSTPDNQLSLILFKTLCKPASAGWTEKVTAGMLGQRLGRRGMTVIILGFGKIPPELRNCSFLLHTGWIVFYTPHGGDEHGNYVVKQTKLSNIKPNIHESMDFGDEELTSKLATAWEEHKALIAAGLLAWSQEPESESSSDSCVSDAEVHLSLSPFFVCCPIILSRTLLLFYFFAASFHVVLAPHIFYFPCYFVSIHLSIPNLHSPTADGAHPTAHQ
jgi:hypothetical protein